MSNNKPYYVLSLSYPADQYPAMDKKIEKLIGSRDGSGMGFGERDMDWTFDTKQEALAAWGKLKGKGLELHFVDITKTDPSKEWDDDDYSITIKTWKA